MNGSAKALSERRVPGKVGGRGGEGRGGKCAFPNLVRCAAAG